MSPRGLSRGLAALCGLALLVRLLALPLPGTVDTKAWKAWSQAAAREGLAAVYGPPDREVVRVARDAGGPAGILHGFFSMTWPRHAFFYRGEYHIVDYPPLSMVLLWAAGEVELWLDPGETSGPLFNVLINIPPLLGSFAMALLLRRSAAGELGISRALAFWINPAVLLGASILGYEDAVFGVAALGAALAMDRGRTGIASALVVTAGLLKPQGSLLLPTFLALLFFENGARAWLKAAFAGLSTAGIILAPFWTQGHLLSALDGCRRPLEEATVSAQSLNLGWIAGWVLQWIHEGPFPLARILTLEQFEGWAGFDAELPSRILLAAGTLVNVVLLLWRPREDRVRVPLSLILQAHVYALCGTAVHENHTFLAVFAAPLLLGLWGRARAVLVLTSTFLFLNLFLLEGLGRTLIPDRKLYKLRLLTGVDLSVLVALAHVVLVLVLFAWAAGRRRGGGPAEHPAAA